jgi:Arc/MetJ-type ribon-helix-helix transcriptional regulator
MDIALTPEQEDAAILLVKAGLFASRDEAVSRSHEWLSKEAGKLEAIRAALEQSDAQSERGESRPLDADDMIARLRKRLAERRSD